MTKEKTKQGTTYALAPIKPNKKEMIPYRPPEEPKGRELMVILKERGRQEYIMRGQASKGKLATTLAAEIAKHYFKEVGLIGKFMREELRALQGDEELYKFMRELMIQEFPVIAEEITGIRTESVYSIRAAIQWSLDILPEKEHKGFWAQLFGG